MTTTRIPLVAQINVTIVSQAVTAAYGSAGDLVNYSAACSSVLLRNPGEVWPIEFKVGSGAWTRLEIYNTTLLGISLDTTTIRVRKALANSGSGLVQLDIRGLASIYLAGDDAVDLGGDGAAAFTDLTDVLSSTLYAKAIVGVNDAGNALYCISGMTVSEEGSFSFDAGAAAEGSLLADNGAEGLTLQGNGDGGIDIIANGDGGVNVMATGTGGIGLTANNESEYSEVYLQSAGVSGIMLSSQGTGGLKITGLPTSDPEVVGEVWNDAGTLKISAGA